MEATQQQAAPEQGTPGGRFGWFGGVFTPSILTILGVIMYLRLGWVTGQGGLGVTLGVVVVAHLITIATGLSVSSIATNRAVGAGGAYFMISRALGAPAGAAIGLPLFFAQALSVTFYIVGFTEAVLQLAPEAWRSPVAALAISSVMNVALAALSLKSAELAIKAQYVVMAAIVLSLVAFFTGRTPDFPAEIEWVNPTGESIGAIFAVFFPAATGLMAGVSMSGELKDPRRAIPIGTMLAIFVGFIVYLAFPVWFALNFSNQSLIENVDAAFKVASVPALIYVGVWGATLSSALGSILTAPRTLMALSHDGLAPGLFGRGYGPDSEPRAGTVLTFVLAQVGIFLGSLDAIAPVLTMFFLATYGVTNLVCGLERWAASPSFRPTFKVPAAISLLGGAACFYVMSIINVAAMAASLVVCALIYLVAQRRALGATYGDARHGLWAALVRSALYRLRRTDFHPQNWRPNLVVFGGAPDADAHLIELGSSLVQDRGMVTYFDLLEGDDVPALAQARRERAQRLEPFVRETFPNVFYRVGIADDRYRGAVGAAQSYGVGNFEANAVMVDWVRDAARADAYVEMLKNLASLDQALMLVRHVPEVIPEKESRRERKKRENRRREVHVWLLDPAQQEAVAGDGKPANQRTQALSLLLAVLLTSDYRWRNRGITVIKPVEKEAERGPAEAELKKLLADARITATPKVVLREGRPMKEVLRAERGHCDFAVIGLSLPGAKEEAKPFVQEVDAMLAELPTTLLVHGARTFAGEDVLQ